MPAFKHRGRPLVGYAGFEDHCSFFPLSTRVMEAHHEELGAYRTSRATIRFAPDRPLPAALARRLVKEQLDESAARGSR
jgi:uncharacterized protein YdhG (YjbR/CyaY superfamily)